MDSPFSPLPLHLSTTGYTSPAYMCPGLPPPLFAPGPWACPLAILPSSSDSQTPSLIKSGGSRHPGMLLLVTHADWGAAWLPQGNQECGGSRAHGKGLPGSRVGWGCLCGRGLIQEAGPRTADFLLLCQTASPLGPQPVCLETLLNAKAAENFDIVEPITQGSGGQGCGGQGPHT